MKRWTAIVGLLLLAVAGVIILSDTDDPNGSAPEVVRSEPNLSPLPAVLVEESSVPTTFERAEEAETSADEDEECLSQDQIESHPLVVADIQRLEPILATGPTIESYRGLTYAELEMLAEQRDSAAMVVLGAMSMLRARGLPDDEAVDYQTLTDLSLHSFTFDSAPDEITRRHYQEAYDWYFRAALHGRVLALPEAGLALFLGEGDAVDLGWIDEETWRQLDNLKRDALDPGNVFSVLAVELEPELSVGFAGEILKYTPRSEIQAEIVAGLAEQFRRDRETFELSPVNIPPTTMPDGWDTLPPVCESYLDTDD